MLGNLLDDALRHTPPVGRVTVGVEHHADGVQFFIADTREGISAHLPHLFERFYRADARDRGPGGSGIGRQLVHEHGGQVTAPSDGPGTGATFTVALPEADA